MCLTNRERNTRGTRGTQEAQEKSSAPSLPDRGSVTACFEGSRRNVLTLYIHSVILFLVRFTWDPDKAAENVRNHKGVTLDEGTEIFSDPNLQEEFDGMHSDGTTLPGNRPLFPPLAAGRIHRTGGRGDPHHLCTKSQRKGTEAI